MFYGSHYGLVSRVSVSQMTTNDHRYVPCVVITIGSFLHSWLIIEFVIRVTRRVLHVEQELPTLPEHLSSPPVLSGIRNARSLVFRVMFCKPLFVCFFVFLSLYCQSCSVYCFWWALKYLRRFLPKMAYQTLL